MFSRAARPAPVIPDLASTTISSASIALARISGTRGRIAQVV